MIYYVSLDNPNPSGGVKTQYRHVEILNKHGYPSSMLHQQPGFLPKNFASTAPISYVPEIRISNQDVLVWPEILRSSIREIPSVRQLIFNQNIHYTWRTAQDQPYDMNGVVEGTMVLTEYERDYLRLFSPNHRVGVVRHGIDPRIFYYDGRTKDRVISFMPRKHFDEAQAVFGWLSQTGALNGWEVIAIDGNTEQETAEILRQSRLFLAFGYPEGGTLPPFEAMACGAEVVGYGGFASSSDMQNLGATLIPEGDTCKFAQIVQMRLTMPPFPRELSQRCLEYFSMENEEKQLLNFMKEVKVID